VALHPYIYIIDIDSPHFIKGGDASIFAVYQTRSWNVCGASVSNRSLSPTEGCDECFWIQCGTGYL